MDLTFSNIAILIVVGVLAGVVNAVVGSGTLLTFPVLVALGVPPVVANATNATGLVPGGFSAVWPYRDDVRARWKRLWPLALVSFIFALFGALLVILLPPSVFIAVVPWLIGGSVVLVALQPFLSRWVKRHADEHGPSHARPTPGLIAAIAGTGTYGGYFGAAQGVLLFAVLGTLDDPDTRRTNGVKNLLATAANVAAAIVFITTGRVLWPAAIALMVGSIVGGYVGGHGAKRLPQWLFRALIIAVGVIAAVSLFLRK